MSPSKPESDRRALGRPWRDHVARLMPELRSRSDDCCELCGAPIDFDAPPRTRRAPSVDAVFVALPVVRLPGYARPLIREGDYLRLLEESSYADDRVRP